MFINERGAPFTVSGFQKLVARAGEAAGLGFPVHPHNVALRAHAATRYRTVLRSSTVLSNTRLMVQIQRLPMNASGYRQ